MADKERWYFINLWPFLTTAVAVARKFGVKKYDPKDKDQKELWLELLKPCLKGSTWPAQFLGAFTGGAVAYEIYQEFPGFFLDDVEEEIPRDGFPTYLAESYAIIHVEFHLNEDDIMEKLKKGYDRLVGFETSSQGYEWFG